MFCFHSPTDDGEGGERKMGVTVLLCVCVACLPPPSCGGSGKMKRETGICCWMDEDGEDEDDEGEHKGKRHLRSLKPHTHSSMTHMTHN